MSRICKAVIKEGGGFIQENKTLTFRMISHYRLVLIFVNIKATYINVIFITLQKYRIYTLFEEMQAGLKHFACSVHIQIQIYVQDSAVIGGNLYEFSKSHYTSALFDK